MRTIKTMGLVLVAICALGAISATAALAQVGKFTSDGPATLTGEETVGAPLPENRLTAFGIFVQCPGSTYLGHEVNSTKNGVPNGSSEATITPKYKETTAGGAPNCTGPLGISATYEKDLDGCDYVVHLGLTTGGVNGTYAVTFDVVCPPGKEITATLWESEALHTSEPNNPFCDLHVADEVGGVPVNQGLKGLHATDEGKGDIILKGTVEGMHIVETNTHGSKILCPGGTTMAGGKFDLNVTVKGDNSSGDGTNISLSHL